MTPNDEIVTIFESFDKKQCKLIYHTLLSNKLRSLFTPFQNPVLHRWNWVWCLKLALRLLNRDLSQIEDSAFKLCKQLHPFLSDKHSSFSKESNDHQTLQYILILLLSIRCLFILLKILYWSVICLYLHIECRSFIFRRKYK